MLKKILIFEINENSETSIDWTRWSDPNSLHSFPPPRALIGRITNINHEKVNLNKRNPAVSGKFDDTFVGENWINKQLQLQFYWKVKNYLRLRLNIISTRNQEHEVLSVIASFFTVRSSITKIWINLWGLSFNRRKIYPQKWWV